MKTNSIIKSKERVRELAEVFTSEREVRSMLDLVKYLSENVGNTFLEPACGNGNFLVEILKRKLDTVKSRYRIQADVEFYTVVALSSIYGIDISEENVLEARERMLYAVKEFYSNTYNTRKPTEHFWDTTHWILEHNIVLGDFLNTLEKILLVEYSTPKKYFFKRQEFRLVDQLRSKKKAMTLFTEIDIPLKSYRVCNYQQLCS